MGIYSGECLQLGTLQSDPSNLVYDQPMDFFNFVDTGDFQVLDVSPSKGIIRGGG